MFIEALFRRVKTWIQSKCPLREEWIKKMWHLYTMKYYSDIKKNEICHLQQHRMDLEIVIHSEVKQREIRYDVFYMQNLKINDTIEHIYKTETDSQT